MRSGKLQYLDHPVLGILVQAEKYEPPVPEPVPEPEPAAAPEPVPPGAPPMTQPSTESTQTPQ
jgi:hypothetical protein